MRTCVEECLPVVVLCIESFVGVVWVVATRVSQEAAGRRALDVCHTNAARLVDKCSGSVSAILWEKIPESKAVVVEAEQDIHPPSVPLHCKCEGVAVVAVLAAFADWQDVAVINGAGIHLHQFQTFREVAGGEFQPEWRLGDEHSAVSADGV